MIFGILILYVLNSLNLILIPYILLQQTIVIFLGFIGALRIIDELNIMNIAVRKDLRRCGIGSALLEFLINFAISQKDGSITLEVNENNTSAIALYKKYNFKQILA